MNEEYDFYTNQSDRVKAQAIWDKTIDSLLEANSAFADTLIVLPLRSKKIDPYR